MVQTECERVGVCRVVETIEKAIDKIEAKHSASDQTSSQHQIPTYSELDQIILAADAACKAMRNFKQYPDPETWKHQSRQALGPLAEAAAKLDEALPTSDIVSGWTEPDQVQLALQSLRAFVADVRKFQDADEFPSRALIY